MNRALVSHCLGYTGLYCLKKLYTSDAQRQYIPPLIIVFFFQYEYFQDNKTLLKDLWSFRKVHYIGGSLLGKSVLCINSASTNGLLETRRCYNRIVAFTSRSIILSKQSRSPKGPDLKIWLRFSVTVCCSMHTRVNLSLAVLQPRSSALCLLLRLYLCTEATSDMRELMCNPPADFSERQIFRAMAAVCT